MDNVAHIIDTEDGSHSLFSEQFAVGYHSKYGAIQESQHVFIQAGLAPALLDKTSLRVFEMGFGSGLNAFLSLLFLSDPQKNIYFETVEAFPLPLAQVSSLNYPSLLNGSTDDFRALHEAPWGEPTIITPQFTLRKHLGTIQEVSLAGDFDVVFFDAFAPSSQPELWEAPVLEKIFQAMAPGGIFVTYCAKGVVKRTLRSIGFQVEGIPGPPGKREMTRATKQ
ncbi:tRNA (5-methylaminomethyl-2-thiouridine)(34)-methyltransferase MnmD [Lewinella sp. LCG006]|uniref:tRNA (5-methylaminomethyl-2-thiouridine)(34)-methyltransferase MnmD n=1 Tax=Lewinella sp. LCG006 TaxID=3231911 RepID=UPI003461214F